MLYVQVGNYSTDQWPHGHSFNLFIEFILEREVCIVQTEPQRFNDVLSHNVLSCSNRFLIMLRAGFMGTEVNNAEISYELRPSHGRRVTSLTLLTKSLVLCKWWDDLPTRGLSTSARTLTTTIGDWAPAGYHWPEGGYWFYGS